MGIGAAIAGGAAVAGIGGALISSSAAKDAANTQAGAADRATQASQAEAAQTRADLGPFRDAGTTATQSLLATLGLPGGNGMPNELTLNGIDGLTFKPTQAQLEATPGYQFDLSQGLQSVQNSNAARGLGISGAALKGAANYATGLANNTLTTQAGIFQNNLSNVMNPLQSAVNLGENAAAQTGALGTSNVNAANQSAIGGANAQASGTVGSANALSNGLGSIGSAPTNYLLYNQLLGNGGVQTGDEGALAAARGAATGNNFVGNSGLSGLY